MVPPAKIELTQPETLPADFSEWDSGENLAKQPVSTNAAPGSGAAPRPLAKPAVARVTASPVAGRLPNTASLRPAAVAPKDESSYLNAKNHMRLPQAADVKLEGLKLWIKGQNRVKVTVVAAGSILILFLLIFIPLHFHKSQSSTLAQKGTTGPQSQPTNAMSATNTSATITPSATNTPEPTTDSAQTVRVQSKMMNDQLAAPTRIPRDLKIMGGKEAQTSSGFSAAGMEGLGGSGAAGSIFSGQTGPKVKVESPGKVNISAGVANGLLLRKTAPFYPSIAKTARVSGTVVLQATISKTGSIENLRVISGPAMLQQSALEAVKTWRYRPYMLNNASVEVDTTVNVIFSLGE